MKYPERIARRGSRPFHTAISTTFAIEFNAFEEVMLPQIMASGATNTLLVSDARMATMALSDGTLLPHQLGRDYEMVSPPSGLGLFHPKILLQLGRKSGRLFVGSANVTASGIAGNAEAIVEVECTDESSPEQEVIRAAWRYLSRVLQSEREAARDALDWAWSKTPWLAGEVAADVQTLADGSLMGFLAGGPEERALSERFVEALGGDAVERLTVISPYWDDRLEALHYLTDALRPSQTDILLDPASHQFPIDEDRPDLSFRRLPDRLKGRFAHAKVTIASTATHDHILVGSANCTVPALGRPGLAGRNAEACIYSRVERGKGIQALDLMECLAASPIDPLELEPRQLTPEIPLLELAKLKVGTFEVEGNILTWRVTKVVPTSGILELSDPVTGLEEAIPFGPMLVVGSRDFKLPPEIAPKVAFVVVVGETFRSGATHVTHRSVLRSRRRESATGTVARAADLFDAGADFELFMHQAFDDLARADMEEDTAQEIAAARPGRARADKPEPEHRKLSYEEFMQLRSPDRSGAGRQEGTITGKHIDSVRLFLNKLVGLAPLSEVSSADDGWLDNEDEDGEDKPSTANPAAPGDGGADLETERARKDFDVKKVSDSIRAYIANSTAEMRPTGPSDVMRLRLWLMFLIHKAKYDDNGGLATTGDETGWPMMARRIISAFFVGKSAPIRRLMIAREYSEMPPDFLETWATVIWTLQTIEKALGRNNHDAQFMAFVLKLKAEVALRLALTPAELASPAAADTLSGLGRTLGPRILSFAPSD